MRNTGNRQVQALQNAIRRMLTRTRKSWTRLKRKRSRERRRRQRAIEWDKANQRGSQPPVSCAFCAATRSWLTDLWQRFVRAGLEAGRKLSDLAAGIFQASPVAEADKDSAASRRIFHRRSYPGSRTRRFELHLPRGYRDASAMPMLVVLHGCRQDNHDIRRISNFDAIADREGFIVVYPFVTGYSGMRIRNCWGWWIESEIRPGAGEVEDLWQIVEQVKSEVNVDARRIHIAGLSSGAGMAVAAMVAHHDKIASGAVVAGVPYSETARAVAYGAPAGVVFTPTAQIVESMKSVMGEQGRPSPVLIVHSSDDPVVDIQAARNIRDSWAKCFGIDTTRPVVKSSGTTGGQSWVHCGYRETRRRSAIETLFIEGFGHGWYGGSPGKFSYPAAPNASEFMWRFFKRHPLHSESRINGKFRQERISDRRQRIN